MSAPRLMSNRLGDAVVGDAVVGVSGRAGQQRVRRRNDSPMQPSILMWTSLRVTRASVALNFFLFTGTSMTSPIPSRCSHPRHDTGSPRTERFPLGGGGAESATGCTAGSAGGSAETSGEVSERHRQTPAGQPVAGRKRFLRSRRYKAAADITPMRISPTQTSSLHPMSRAAPRMEPAARFPKRMPTPMMVL